MVRLEDVRVVFVEPLFEINIGYVARAMKNFGLRRLYIVSPRTEVGDVALTYSVHAREIVKEAVVVDTLAEAVEGVPYVVGTTGKAPKRDKRVVRIPITPEELAKNLADYEGEVAILLGREDVGLRNEELAMCNVVVTIPASPEYPILNVSHAAAVIFYEIYKWNARAARRAPFSFARATREDVALAERYFDELVEALHIPEHKRRVAKLVFRRMLGRSLPSRRELYAIVGVLRRASEAARRATTKC